MAYKDKEKQKEVNRERQRRYRALRQGVTNEPLDKALHSLGVTESGRYVEGAARQLIMDTYTGSEAETTIYWMGGGLKKGFTPF